MKVAVVGAGAIGAFVGACLARGGTETHLVARGRHLEAMRRDGVRVTGPIGDFTIEVPAIARIASCRCFTSTGSWRRRWPH